MEEFVKRMRIACTGFAPVHVFSRVTAGAAAALLLAVAPVSAAEARAKPAKPAKTVATKPLTGDSVSDFYRARNDQPLWLTAEAGHAAQNLFLLLSNARIDGLDPASYRLDVIQQALQAASRGDRKAVAQADRLLSEAFVAYARDLRRDPGLGVIYVDAELKPVTPSPRALLNEAASAPSLADHVARLGWMNPIYGQLRTALMRHAYGSEERQRIQLNLERARSLPVGKRKYVLVHTAQQRLFMVEDGRMVDSMRVVVGKPKYPTPMMAALVRYASLNPYWFVPPDLAAERIAPLAAKRGKAYLDELGYQLLSDWTNDASVIDPSVVDWSAVAEGRTEVRLRQLPGPHNAMGRMKFMFPNAEGIYLHDNPDRELFEHAARLYSGGCVRLEDAARLGRWLFGRELVWEGASTEEKVLLTPAVPVYITYLTAMPEGSAIAYYDDVYGRDAARVASLAASGTNSGR